MNKQQAKELLEWACYVPPELWGRDHFTTLMYLETVVVNHGGKLSLTDQRMREWGRRGKYPTRCRYGIELDNHDDWNCLDDFADAGLVTIDNDIYLNSIVIALTDTGWNLVRELRTHKAKHGDYKLVNTAEIVGKIK